AEGNPPRGCSHVHAAAHHEGSCFLVRAVTDHVPQGLKPTCRWALKPHGWSRALHKTHLLKTRSSEFRWTPVPSFCNGRRPRSSGCAKSGPELRICAARSGDRLSLR